jgi:uncharacterized membrane protein YhaH (DUF805 family)
MMFVVCWLLVGSLVVNVLYMVQDNASSGEVLTALLLIILGPLGFPFMKASQAIYRWRDRRAVAEHLRKKAEK